MGIEQVERDGLFDHTVPERPGFGSSEASAKGVDTDVGPTGDVCGGAVDVAVWSGAPVDCDICGGEGCEACGVGGGGGGRRGEGDGLPGGGGGGGVEGGEEGEGGVEGVVVGCLEFCPVVQAVAGHVAVGGRRAGSVSVKRGAARDHVADGDSRL